jgi:hypothetical protein
MARTGDLPAAARLSRTAAALPTTTSHVPAPLPLNAQL